LVYATTARELVREVDYTLKTLSSSLLGQHREDLSPPDVPRKFESTTMLIELCRHAEGDAWLALGIMFNLSGQRWK
jgi:DNA polymerase alpha subunit A